MHLAAVWAFDFQRCLPSGLKALHIGLDADAGGRLLVFGQKMREAICCSFLVQAGARSVSQPLGVKRGQYPRNGVVGEFE